MFHGKQNKNKQKKRKVKLKTKQSYTEFLKKQKRNKNVAVTNFSTF